MKFKNLIVAAAILLMPVAAFAADFRSGESISLGSGEDIKQDLYAAGNSVTIDSKIDGDLFAAGKSIVLTGEVSQSAYLAGEQVTVDGKIDRSLKVGSGNVSIKGEVDGDIFIAGGTVVIEKGATTGDVYVAAGTLTVYGSTGLIKAATSNIYLKDGAKIDGDINYWSKNKISQTGNVEISGTVTQKDVANYQNQSKDYDRFASIFSILLLLVMAMALFLIFPKSFRNSTKMWKEKFGFSLLWGFLFVFLAPFSIFILAISVIGIPLAVGLALLYPIYLFMGKVVGVIALGSWLEGLYSKKEMAVTILSVVIGVVAYGILSQVPGIAVIAKLLVLFAGTGVLIDFTIKGLAKLRD